LYTILRHDRNDGYGGVLIGIKEDLNIIEYMVDKVSEFVMCKILLPPVYLCTVYRVPNSDLSHFEAVMSTLPTYLKIIGIHQFGLLMT